MAVDMSAFKHVVVPLGVIIGLGVVHIVTTLSGYLENRKQVRFSIAHGLWMAITLFWMIGLWWMLWQFRVVDIDRWSFYSLLLLLVGPVTLYFSASLLLPKQQPGEKLDLGVRLDHVGRLLFICMSVAIVWLGICELVLLQQRLLEPHRFGQIAAFVLLVGSALVPTRRAAMIVGVIFLVSTLITFGTFRQGLI